MMAMLTITSVNGHINAVCRQCACVCVSHGRRANISPFDLRRSIALTDRSPNCFTAFLLLLLLLLPIRCRLVDRVISHRDVGTGAILFQLPGSVILRIDTFIYYQFILLADVKHWQTSTEATDHHHHPFIRH